VCGNNNVVEDFLVNIGPVIEISTKITTGNIYTKHIHVGVGSNTSGDVFGRGGLFIQLLPAWDRPMKGSVRFADGREQPLGESSLILGRSNFLASLGISRKQCEICKTDDGFVVKAFGLNPTLLLRGDGKELLLYNQERTASSYLPDNAQHTATLQHGDTLGMVGLESKAEARVEILLTAVDTAKKAEIARKRDLAIQKRTEAQARKQQQHQEKDEQRQQQRQRQRQEEGRQRQEEGEQRQQQPQQQQRQQSVGGEIEYKRGDLLVAPVEAIVQQCNCVTIDGRGLSAQIASRLPHGNPYARRRQAPGDRRRIAGPEDQGTPGEIEVGKHDGATTVISLFGQFESGGPLKYNRAKCPKGPDSATNRELWFQEGLDRISALKPVPASIGFPHQIGCGLGGGNWEAYRRMLERFASQHPEIQVTVWAFGGADESGGGGGGGYKRKWSGRY